MREREFERIYGEHAQALFGFLMYRTGDRSLAEDLLADTFERALRGRDRFDRRKGRERTWLYAIALNLVRDTARRQAAEQRALERSGTVASAPAAESSFEAVHDRELITRTLGVLSAEEREAIALRYGADLTVPEIAELTRERLSTVEGRVYRGLRKLRDELEA
jgi:RNA polymerase sigma-70 factor, ECF subfamily